MMFKILHQFDEAKPRRREVGGNYPIFKIHNIDKFYKSYLSVSKNDFLYEKYDISRSSHISLISPMSHTAELQYLKYSRYPEKSAVFLVFAVFAVFAVFPVFGKFSVSILYQNVPSKM